jgi:hypothetical protein
VTNGPPLTLEQALAKLKRLTDVRRGLARGTPEYAAAVTEEVEFAATVYELAHAERAQPTAR